MKKDVQQFMNRRVVVLNDHDTVEQAARAMSEQHVGCVLTSTKTGISGIVTDRDLACHVVAEQLSADTRLSDVHTQEDLNFVYEEATLKDVIELMKKHGVRRVPILKELTGRTTCVGIVTVDDLIIDGIISLKDLKEIIKPQIPYNEKRPSTRIKQRKEARKEQSLNIFFKTLAREMDIDRHDAEPIIVFLLKGLVRRVTPGEASDLISSLPVNIQETLRENMTGPDRRVNAEFILRQMKVHFGLTSAAAERRVKGFWIGLELYLLNNECQHILSQLPNDLQLLLTGEIFKKSPTSKRHHGSASVPQQ
jgi:CBS domain-containing protein/uncharacterized protein (DUF2267 family)